MHAEIRLGDSIVYLCDEFPDASVPSPQSLGGSRGASPSGAPSTCTSMPPRASSSGSPTTWAWRWARQRDAGGAADFFGRSRFGRSMKMNHGLSPGKIRVLVGEARRAGVRKLLVTHPTLGLSGITPEDQKPLAGDGPLLEKDPIAMMAA